MQENSCKNCGAHFTVTSDDLEFYKKISPTFNGKIYQIPAPTLCPDCRFQRRLAMRNEHKLYKRKCDLCGKTIIALFPEKSEYKVYCQDCWWGDKMDAHSYAQDFDFSRPFFEQFNELLKKVPAVQLINDLSSLQNSEYVNFVSDAKNCYLVFAANWLEDCMFSTFIWKSKDTLDSAFSPDLELCYECVDCDHLYNCDYLQNSESCSDCVLSFDLKNCSHCFGCVNLRNKNYHFFNEQLEKGEYEARVNEIRKDSQKFQEAQEKFEQFRYRFPHLYAHQIHCENSTGDAIKNCKNVFNSFEGYESEDCKNMFNFPGACKDCMDVSGCAEIQLVYDSACVFPGYNVSFSNMILNGGSNILYSAFCVNNCKNLFGCVGVKKDEYSILNKKYSREEYEVLVPKIIEHMKRTGEFGEFFPVSISQFGYNETSAQDYFSMTREQALQKGYKWRD